MTIRKPVMKILLLSTLFISFATVLHAAGLEHRFEIKNSYEKHFYNKSRFNPDNILLIDYPYLSSLWFNSDLKLYLTDIINITFYDTFRAGYEAPPTAGNRYNDFEIEQKDQVTFDNTLKQCYVSLNLKDRLFFDLGKKVERNGVSFYKNPSDFMVHSGGTDLSRPREEQNALLEGNVLAKMEFFATPKLYVSTVYSPESSNIGNKHDQILAKIAYQFENSDIDFIFYYNDNCKFGSNYSVTVTDNMEIHLEASLSDCLQKSVPGNNGPQILIKEKTGHYVLKNIIGGHYTFTDGGELYCEYLYDQNGYTTGEWNNIISIVNSNQEVTNRLNRLNIYTINDMLDQQGGFSGLRRHYVMLRYNKNNVIGDLNVTGTAVLGLEQWGGLLTITPSYTFTDDLMCRFDLTVFKGEPGSEFEVIFERWFARFECVYTF